MSSFFLLTAFGPDRPGRVAELTREVFQLKGNIEDTSMTRLGGEFVMMLVISLPSAKATEKLLLDIPQLQRKHALSIALKPLSAGPAKAKAQQPTHIITIYGADRTGIVYRVAQTLAEARINITDLQTKVTGPARKPVYVMLLEVQVPSAPAASKLQQRLKRLASALRLDIKLREIENATL